MNGFRSAFALRTRPAHRVPKEGRRLRIGLVNNMPDAALLATENQFRRLLDPDGSGTVRLDLFHLSTVPRSEAGWRLLRGRSRPADQIRRGDLDGLIVTGCEPRRPDLREEPFWDAFRRLVDWAEAEAVPTLWSCLAAHAAVLHLDDVRRQPLPAKASGVFPCRHVSGHPLLAGLPDPVPVPHSRLNGLGAEDLAAHGYAILTASDRVGVDLFVRARASLFVFAQGHPEYDGDTLGREFRRDLARHLHKGGPRPAVPSGYFDQGTEAMLRGLDQADPDVVAAVLAGEAAQGPHLARQAEWQGAAARLYENWLALLAELRGPPTPLGSTASQIRPRRQAPIAWT